MSLKKIKIFFKKNLTTITLIAIGVFLFCGSFGSSLRETWELYSYKQDLIAQIEAKREESKQLDEDIKQIGSQEYIERIARQYLELYYPNEQIVIPVENEMAKDNSQNQEPVANQPQTAQDQSVDQQTESQEITSEDEAIENTNPDQQEPQSNTTEEQETVQEEEQTTTNE